MKTIISILSVLALTLTTATAFSNARDSDGTRIQARSIQFGKAVNDKVNPPTDKTDWFYFRIKESRNVSIQLSTKSNDGRLTLSNTVGKSISILGTKKKGLYRANKLKPGIYYISVSSSKGMSYSLSIK